MSYSIIEEHSGGISLKVGMGVRAKSAIVYYMNSGRSKIKIPQGTSGVIASIDHDYYYIKWEGLYPKRWVPIEYLLCC